MFSGSRAAARWLSFLLKNRNTQQRNHPLFSLYCTLQRDDAPCELLEMCKVVSSSIGGGLDDLESSLSRFGPGLTSPLVRKVMDSCKCEAPSRRLLRFFMWSRKSLDFELKDEDFNYAIRVLAEKKDHTALQILVSDFRKDGRVMETQTFVAVAEALVKLGREDEAFGIFKNLDKFKCPQDRVAVTAIVSALCAKGHAKKAQEVVWHHKDKILGVMPCIYRNLLHGWSVKMDGKEARKVIREMRGNGIMPDLFCYQTFLRCICERNSRRNPSGLVPEALDVMVEMRSHNIQPNSVSYNILLSCLGRTRRVKESVSILQSMKNSGCAPDWVSYYLVVRVLYLTGRFSRGNKMVNEMMEQGLVPDRQFYYELIGVLCGVEKVNYALELFEQMKRNTLGGYGPVYDVLIPKLCRLGNYEKGRELWDEAMSLRVTLNCSSDVLDPSITEVFKPTKEVTEEVRLKDIKMAKRPKTGAPRRGKMKRNLRSKRWRRR